MKGTAMTVIMGGTLMLASATDTCDFKVPASFHANPNFKTFSCELSESCCHGLQDAERMAEVAKGGGKPQGGKGRFIGDVVGTCGRADQRQLYTCAIQTALKMAPDGPSKQRILAKGDCKELWEAEGDKKCDDRCEQRQRALAKGDRRNYGRDGYGHCSVNKGKGKGTIEIDGVSGECCEAGNNFLRAAQDIVTETTHPTPHSVSVHMAQKEPAFHNSQCGLIGACGKEDQKSIMRSVKEHDGSDELELLEMFNMTNVAPLEMLATILTSEDEVIEDEADVTEDDATEGSSPIVTGILGFVAGAAVMGLGVTVLRRGTPSSEDRYNEIVA